MSTVQAEGLFRRFFGRNPDKNEIVEIATKEPEVCLVIGELDGIIYRTEQSKEPLIHRFAKSARPLFLVSSDGRQIYVFKGKYRFTERGIVG